MIKNSKDILFIIGIVVVIILGWAMLYSNGVLDEKLLDAVKKETISKVLDRSEVEKTDEKEVESEKNILTNNNIAVFETTLGKFEIELYDGLMPITTKNFEKLVESNFYDGIRFHRVIDDFMIQAGDPNSKDLSKKNIWGQGGPGYAIKDEFVKNEKLTNEEYTIAMANAGPNTGGSQFFINTKNNQFLDFDKQPLTSKHPVFGKVISGTDVVDKIEKSKNGEVVIKKVYLK